MNKEKIYQIIAIAASGLMVLFGVLFLVFSAKWRSLNKNVRSLETMLTDAVKETAQLKSEIRLLSDGRRRGRKHQWERQRKLYCQEIRRLLNRNKSGRRGAAKSQ